MIKNGEMQSYPKLFEKEIKSKEIYLIFINLMHFSRI